MRARLPIARFAAAAALLVLTACASAPKPTQVRMDFDVRANVNPDAKGRPSPVVLRVLALKSRAGFDSAAFFALYDKAQETLGSDLVESAEFEFRPGEQRTVSKEYGPEVRDLAFFVAFRDPEHARWAAAVPIPAPSTLSLGTPKFPVEIRLDGNTVAAAAKP